MESASFGVTRERDAPATSRPEPEATHTVWQVKASTLCNLRCKYCYEWDRLADRFRMPLASWRRILEAAAAYRVLRRDRHGVSAQSLILWHGGEPLLLPPDYVRAVVALEDEILGSDRADEDGPLNVVQTNLFQCNETLETMIEAGFLFNVSHDAGTGARVDGAGRDSEGRVGANLEALLSRGVTCGVALVLGRHNHLDLPEIHDSLERMGVHWLRINPLFAPPETAPGASLALSPEEIVQALGQLYEHRQKTGSGLPVEPLDRVQQAVARHRGDQAGPLYARRGYGVSRFVVHPDGTFATQAGTTSGEHVLGNILGQDLEEILGSDLYLRSLDRDDAKRAEVCGRCRFHRACNGRALLETPIASLSDPCPVEAKLCAFMEAHDRTANGLLH